MIKERNKMNYSEFITSKLKILKPDGLKIELDALNPKMRPDQRLVTHSALTNGRYAIFADCGLGKTLDELEWARQVSEQGIVLIVAPLCVAQQTIAMGKQFGYEVNLCKGPEDLMDGINITNYDRLFKFECAIKKLRGVVLNESSIIKNVDGKMRNFILSAFKCTPYRLAETATPAPNDHMELGNHAEFLGICTRNEMLANYFVHDGENTSKWRLKRHAEADYWRWVSTWSTTYSKPSDLDESFSDDGFELPELRIHQHILDYKDNGTQDELFESGNIDLKAHRIIKRNSVKDRVGKCAELTMDNPGSWVHWCDLNTEASALVDAIPGAKQICGADSIEEKEEILWAFTSGQLRTLVTKYRITSFGLNWQHCNKTTFGAVHSFEQVYQAIKRFHRFGQSKPVDAHFVLMDSEYNVFKNLQRKFKNNDREITCLTN